MCGQDAVRRRSVSVKLRNGRVVEDVQADVCDRCGERYYDLQAMERIERARQNH
jgi:YgiT-type zinc finger domain-containing protein